MAYYNAARLEIHIARRWVMGNRYWVVGFLFLGVISTYAQAKPEEIFQQAITHGATLTCSYEEGQNEDIKISVKQRRNLDGSVWRVKDIIRDEDLSGRYWSFNTKRIYNSDGFIDLMISQNEITGIVTQDEIPRHKIGKDSTFKMTSITYDGRSCWKITEHLVGGEVYEAIIDKKYVFVLTNNYYNSSGKLLYSIHKKNVNFNPVFTEADFLVPPNAKLRYAKNNREYSELLDKRIHSHSKLVTKTRKQMAKKTIKPKPQGKLRRQWDMVTNYDTLGFVCQKAPWFLMPIAIVAVGIVVWNKRKKGRN